MASNYPEEGRFASEGGDEPPRLPVRASGPGHPEHIEARAELRDRETYYTELRLAVHCQNRSHPPAAPHIPAARTPLDEKPDTWTRSPHQGPPPNEVDEARRTQDESWDEMVARFGDTWT